LPLAPPAAAPTPPGPADDDDTEPVPESRPNDKPVTPLPAPRWNSDQLRDSLLRVPEVWLQPPSVPTVPKTGKVSGAIHPVLALIEARPDLRGLPVRNVADVRLSAPESDAFRDVSVLLRK